jgi:hypothetical protein
MVSKWISPYLLLAIMPVVFLSCSDNKQEATAAITAPAVIKDTIPLAGAIIEAAEQKPDFTGKYSLWTDHFKPVYFQRDLSLAQAGDSVFGKYRMELYYNKKELIGYLEGDVKGNITVYGEKPEYDADLTIIVTERKLDSLKLSYQYVQFSVDHYFSSDVSFRVTYSKEKNTIEHNYAGGEWDTWQKSE